MDIIWLSYDVTTAMVNNWDNSIIFTNNGNFNIIVYGI